MLRLLILVGIFASTALTCLIILTSAESERGKLKNRIDELVANWGAQKPRTTGLPDNLGVGEEQRSGKRYRRFHLDKGVFFQRLDRAFAGRRFADAIAGRLRRADLKFQVSEFVAAKLGLGILLGLVGFVLTGNFVALLFFALGLWLPEYYLAARASSRVKAVNGQLPDTLSIMSNSLKSGYSFLQAMDVISRELPPPISHEFGQVMKETRVNVSVEDALENLLRRVPSDDLDLVITALLIQRQVGGNLAEVLDKINSTIRERVRLKGQIRTLTAQGRLSGIIVSLLPVGLGLVIYLIDPGYIKPMFSNVLGQIMLGFAAVMQGIGILVIRSLVSMEV